MNISQIINKTFRALNNYATFSGKSDRSECWLYFLIIFFPIMTLCDYLGEIPYGLAFYSLFIPSSALIVRRFRDTGLPGYIYWVLIISAHAAILNTNGIIDLLGIDSFFGYSVQYICAVYWLLSILTIFSICCFKADFFRRNKHSRD